MFRLIASIVITLMVVGFSFANSHHVLLGLGFGPPLQIRLIFLLITTFVLGMATPVFYLMVRRAKRQMEDRKEEVLKAKQAEHQLLEGNFIEDVRAR